MPDPWECSTCGRAWPVQSLARDCERTHCVEVPSATFTDDTPIFDPECQ